MEELEKEHKVDKKQQEKKIKELENLLKEKERTIPGEHSFNWTNLYINLFTKVKGDDKENMFLFYIPAIICLHIFLISLICLIVLLDGEYAIQASELYNNQLGFLEYSYWISMES